MHLRPSFRLPSAWRPILGFVIAALCCGATPVSGGLPSCAGDCDANRQVAIDELIRGLRIALGQDPLSRCPAIDVDNSGAVAIDELIVAVNAALQGCPPTVGPTPTEVDTPTPTEVDTPTPTEVDTPTPTEPPDTPTPSATATVTLTSPPSGTPTLTPTSPPSATPSLSPTPSPTETPTVTPTLSPTPRATPPLSTRVCGNGTMEPGEECDDANVLDSDGCSAVCRSESHPDPCAGAVPVTGTNLTAVRVASGLAQPLHATSPPGDVDRLFIVEQTGRIRILKDGQLLTTPFLDLHSRVIAGGERGLLGLAFHPQYATNGQFFVDYTAMRGPALLSVISRFRVSANPDIADPDSEEILLEQEQPFVAHNGGQLAFDATGYLYIAFGDGGQSAAQQNNAQDPTTWLGKILRIDVDGGTPYAIPADNPHVGPDGVLDEIWAMGLRNPWRFSFDRATGDVYIGDVGEGSREEIDIVDAGAGGRNFGWCCREGSTPFPRCFRAAMTCPADGLISPVLEYDHDAGCSVSGGFVYRGCMLPDLHGTYFYADYCSEFIRSFVYRNGAAEDQHDWTAELAPAGGMTIDRIVAFAEDGRGELHICDLGGEVFKIVPAPQ